MSYIDTAEVFFESLKHKNMPNIENSLAENCYMTDFNGTCQVKNVCVKLYMRFFKTHMRWLYLNITNVKILFL